MRWLDEHILTRSSKRPVRHPALLAPFPRVHRDDLISAKESITGRTIGEGRQLPAAGCATHPRSPREPPWSATLQLMSTPTALNDDNFEGLEVVVGTDGALTVPADELARYGVRPGAHLRLVEQPQARAPRRSARGILAGVIDAEALDAFTTALADSKAERIAAVERRWA